MRVHALHLEALWKNSTQFLRALGNLAVVPSCPLLLAVTCSPSASPAEYRNMGNFWETGRDRDAGSLTPRCSVTLIDLHACSGMVLYSLRLSAVGRIPRIFHVKEDSRILKFRCLFLVEIWTLLSQAPGDLTSLLVDRALPVKSFWSPRWPTTVVCRGLGCDGDAGSLTPRCSVAPLACKRAVTSPIDITDTSCLHHHHTQPTHHPP